MAHSQYYLLMALAITASVAPHACAVEMTIPCNADSFMLFSYNDYTIRDCTRPGGSPFLFLGTSPNASALIDVSITVLNGAVIPQLFSNTIARLENVSVLISGARVGPYHRVITAPTQSPSLSIVTVYSAAFEPFVAKNISMIVHNITVVINTSTPVHEWNVDIHGDFLLSLPLVGPAEVNGLLVNVTDSVIVLHFDGHPLYRNVGIVAVDFQSARSKLAHVSIYVIFSTVSIVADMALTNFTREMSPCHFHFLCRRSGCSASKISYAAHDNSLLRMEYTMPGYGNAATQAIHWLADSAGIFATRDFSDISAIAFDLHNTSASVSCDCRTRCGFLMSGERGLLSAAVFLITSINVDDAVTQDVTVQISLASLSISAPMDAYAVSVSFLLNVSTVSVTIADANVSILGAGLYIGGEARTDSVVGFIKIKFGSRIMAALSRVAQSVVHESAGCASATASMLTFTGNFSNIIATLHQVSLNAQSVRGVVVPSDLVPGMVTFAVVITLASLITLAPYSLIPTYYYYVDIIINSSTIEAAHVTNALPDTSYATVASMVSAFSIVTPVANSSVTLLGVRVVRRRPSTVDVDPDSWIPETFAGARSNVTATVTMFNPLSFFLSSIQDPLIHAIASSIAGSGVISLVNVTVNVTLHCVVEYEVGMLPSIVDVPSLLVLPNEANFSRFFFSDSTLRIPLGSEGVGSLVAGYSKATLYETQITMQAITASSSVLLLTKSNTLTVLLGPTLSMYLMFLDISLVAPFTVGVGASSLVASSDNGLLHLVVVVSSQRNSTTPSTTVIFAQGSNFSGFTTIVAPTINVTALLVPSSAVVLLHLGCNVWNSRTMHSSIVQQTDPHLVRFSKFSECNTPSAPPLIRNAGKATNSVNAAVYVSLLSGVSSITTLQRSATVLRLWQRCHRQEDDSTGSSSVGDDLPSYSELSDNSLGLSLPVGEQSLEYAAGAAFGNALLVLILGGLLHVMFLSQKWLMSHSDFGQRKSSAFYVCLQEFIPSNPFPGSLADKFTTLLQPSSGACAALLVSPLISVGSIFSGAVMAAVWLAFPCFCVHAVMWRGRRKRMFVLRRSKLRAAGAPVIASSCVTFATGSLQEWKVHPSCLHRGTKERSAALFLLQRLEPVFGRFVEGREWYFLVEWSISILSGALLGAAQVAPADTACAAGVWGGGSSIAFAALQIVLCVAFNPFSQRLELWMAVLLGIFEFVSCVLAMLNLGDAADSVVTAAASLDIAVSIIVMLLQLVLRFNKKRGNSAAELGGAKWKQGTMDHERHGGRRVRIQHACQNDRARATTHRNTMFALKEVQEAKKALQLESLIILICGPRRKIS